MRYNKKIDNRLCHKENHIKDNMEKDNIHRLIQGYLKDPPVVIWGSGATAGFRLPSMQDLNGALKSQFPSFNESNNNLEDELGKDKYKDNFSNMKALIYKNVRERDLKVLIDILKNPSKYEGIKKMIEKFLEPHPHIFNTITTNYDRVLEYVLAFYNINYVDGFSGRLLSVFDEELFDLKYKSIVQLIKVHGSLNWFKVDDEIRYFDISQSYEQSYEPVIIPPGKRKYEMAYDVPYRDLIRISDDLIKKAKSLLIVGFGFNDAHLTPKIKECIKKNIPVVVLAKNITQATADLLNAAGCFLAIEESGNDNESKLTYKNRGDQQQTIITITGSLWQLKKFMEIF